ncbi:unnamed protein product, partial [Prorocentrum cordatum]
KARLVEVDYGTGHVAGRAAEDPHGKLMPVPFSLPPPARGVGLHPRPGPLGAEGRAAAAARAPAGAAAAGPVRHRPLRPLGGLPGPRPRALRVRGAGLPGVGRVQGSGQGAGEVLDRPRLRRGGGAHVARGPRPRQRLQHGHDGARRELRSAAARAAGPRPRGDQLLREPRPWLGRRALRLRGGGGPEPGGAAGRAGRQGLRARGARAVPPGPRGRRRREVPPGGEAQLEAPRRGQQRLRVARPGAAGAAVDAGGHVHGALRHALRLRPRRRGLRRGDGRPRARRGGAALGGGGGGARPRPGA